jgi:PEP-CTERM motif
MLIGFASMAVAAAALPRFTIKEDVNGGTGNPQIVADTMLLSKYSFVAVNGSTFTETGFLGVTGFQLDGASFVPRDLNRYYGIFFPFTATGTTTGGERGSAPTFSSLTSFDFTLGVSNQPAVLGFNGNTPTNTASVRYTLNGLGKLVSGTSQSMPDGSGRFTTSELDGTTFSQGPSPRSFISPNPFYTAASFSFFGPPGTVEPVTGGYRVRNAAGTFSFVSTVPEPGTLALMSLGLAAVGFASRRRPAMRQLRSR